MLPVRWSHASFCLDNSSLDQLPSTVATVPLFSHMCFCLWSQFCGPPDCKGHTNYHALTHFLPLPDFILYLYKHPQNGFLWFINWISDFSLRPKLKEEYIYINGDLLNIPSIMLKSSLFPGSFKDSEIWKFLPLLIINHLLLY
jgi:hypothetical protein